MTEFYFSQDNHQQRVYISYFSLSVINDDIDSFCNLPSKKLINSFLNQIIMNMYQEAKCSFSKQRGMLEIEYNKMLTGVPNKKSIAEKLSVETIKLFREKLDEQRKIKKGKLLGKSIILSLNKELKSMLEISSEAEYYESCKDYLEALIFEYSNLSYSERERIYFGKKYKQLQHYISEQEEVIFSLSGKNYKVKPYCITTDRNNTYNYLIGYSFHNENWNIQSFRLQRIETLHSTKAKFSFDVAELKELDELIRNQDIPYLSHNSNDETITVRLSDRGYYLYRTIILFQRPSNCKVIKCEPDNNILAFHCTEAQAYNYFIKFGADVEVIEPASLRQKFSEMHKKASQYYD